MIKHSQRSDINRGFWRPVFVGEVLQPCVYYWRNLEIQISGTDLSGLNDGDRVFVENDEDPLHLVEAFAGDVYAPLSGDPASSPGPVVWKEAGEIHYLTHVEG